MRIGVIGTGRGGLVTGAHLADFGHDVVCANQDPARLRGSDAPPCDAGLPELVRVQVAAGRLRFGDVGEAVRDADMALIEGGGADLAQVLSAAEAIGQALTGYMVVAIRPALPAGTAEMVTAVLREATGQPFSVVIAG